MGFPGGSDGKESLCNAEDQGLTPGLGRSPGEGNGYPLQYSCLDNFMDRGAWWATVHWVAKSWTWLSTHAVCNIQCWTSGSEGERAEWGHLEMVLCCKGSAHFQIFQKQAKPGLLHLGKKIMSSCTSQELASLSSLKALIRWRSSAVVWLSPPQIHTLKSYPSSDAIRRWALWEVLKSWSWSLQGWN